MKKSGQNIIKIMAIAILASLHTGSFAQCVLKANINSTPEAFFGSCNGTISVSTVDPDVSYSYLWSNGEKGRFISGLCAGSYSVQINQDQCIFNLTVPIGGQVRLISSSNTNVPEKNPDCDPANIPLGEKVITATIEPDLRGSLTTINVFPNPSKNNVNFRFSLMEKDDVTITVFDISGRILMYEMINAEEGVTTTNLDVSKLFPGIYMIKLQNSSKSVLERIVIE